MATKARKANKTKRKENNDFIEVAEKILVEINLSKKSKSSTLKSPKTLLEEIKDTNKKKETPSS